MRKTIFAVLLIAAAFTFASAQQANSSSSQSAGDAPSEGRAPSAMNEMGRADVRVMDASGSPVKGAYVELTSIWNKGADRERCESYGYTDDRGVIALPPIHMGTVSLEVKAKGYQTMKMDVAINSLADPVKVTLQKK